MADRNAYIWICPGFCKVFFCLYLVISSDVQQLSLYAVSGWGCMGFVHWGVKDHRGIYQPLMFNCIVKHTLEYFCIKSTSGCAVLCVFCFFVSLSVSVCCVSGRCVCVCSSLSLVSVCLCIGMFVLLCFFVWVLRGCGWCIFKWKCMYFFFFFILTLKKDRIWCLGWWSSLKNSVSVRAEKANWEDRCAQRRRETYTRAHTENIEICLSCGDLRTDWMFSF